MLGFLGKACFLDTSEKNEEVEKLKQKIENHLVALQALENKQTTLEKTLEYF